MPARKALRHLPQAPRREIDRLWRLGCPCECHLQPTPVGFQSPHPTSPCTCRLKDA